MQIEPAIAGLNIAFTSEGATLETARDLAKRLRQTTVLILLGVPPELSMEGPVTKSRVSRHETQVNRYQYEQSDTDADEQSGSTSLPRT